YIVVTGPAHGTLTGSGANRIYTPAENYNGPDSFSFKTHDGTVDGNVAVVSITVTPVNDTPVANAQPITTAEDTAVTINLTGSDTRGAAHPYIVVTGPAHGTLTGSGANRIYTPAANYNGPDSFTFKANDGTVDGNVATVSVTVTPKNESAAGRAKTNNTAEDTAVQHT